ncbi:MAG: phosphoribosylamine--glycine ligase [Myxococcales bacterium]|nr:phosphoribosylamine--glycine ligase [Myxococcales bacterium]
MKVLVVGSGGREHALVWKIARSPRVTQVLAAPGSDAMGEHAACFPDVAAGDIEGVTELARAQGVDLVVVGPEDPLAAGIADRLRKAGIATFGPSAAAARLEGSKAFAKAFMARHGIPTAAFEVFDSLDAALAHVRGLPQPGFCVVKADGLAAGKGVAVCDDLAAAEAALAEMMSDRRFGDAGARVVIEERLDTPGAQEASYYAITDGERIVTLAEAQDHKRALDGDRGENTGGMGAYSPAPVFTPEVERRVLEQVVRPAIRGMAEDGSPFVGVLFVGLMIDTAGVPRVVEFNVRFGDPETQALLVRMQSDLVPLLHGAATGTLDPDAPECRPVWGDAAVCVALASGGYPRSYEKGKPIAGLEEAAALDGVVVFHAGTRRGPDGFVTNGGRVLGVTALGGSVAEARERAYAAADRITFEGRHLRRDIASRAL